MTGDKKYSSYALAYNGNLQIKKIFSFMNSKNPLKLDRKYPGEVCY